MSGDRHGVVLIEVLVALVILAAAGISTIGYTTAFIDARLRAEDREERFDRAERILAATALLTGRELDQRLGVRGAGAYSVWVSRPEPTLYRISVTPSGARSPELVTTVVHRTPSGGPS